MGIILKFYFYEGYHEKIMLKISGALVSALVTRCIEKSQMIIIKLFALELSYTRIF